MKPATFELSPELAALYLEYKECDDCQDKQTLLMQIANEFLGGVSPHDLDLPEEVLTLAEEAQMAWFAYEAKMLSIGRGVMRSLQDSEEANPEGFKDALNAAEKASSDEVEGGDEKKFN